MRPHETDRDGRDARGARTRRALLAAAKTRFARDGGRRASVRAVARAARVHPALVAYHFGGKRALYRAVIEEAMERLRSDVLAAVGGARGPRDAAKRALAAYHDHLERDPEVPRLIQRGLMEGDPDVLGIVARSLAPLVEASRSLPLTTGRLGAPRDVFLSFFGAAVAPFLYGPLLARLFGEDPLSHAALARRRQHLEALAELSLSAILRRPGRRA
ncbi:MAG: TetR family transcriptional regulator [Acidobacteriota bacterium]